MRVNVLSYRKVILFRLYFHLLKSMITDDILQSLDITKAVFYGGCGGSLSVSQALAPGKNHVREGFSVYFILYYISNTFTLLCF